MHNKIIHTGMKQIAIFGASGFGREVLPLARQQMAASGISAEGHATASKFEGYKK